MTCSTNQDASTHKQDLGAQLEPEETVHITDLQGGALLR